MKFTLAFLFLFTIVPFANSQIGITDISPAECNDIIEDELCSYINSNGSEMINVNIILKSQIDQNTLRSVAKKANDKKEYRALVINELKRFSKDNQADIMTFLLAEAEANNVTDIKAHWIQNSINCTATANVIYRIAEHPDVQLISYNKDEHLLWDEQSEKAEQGGREITDNITQVNADDVWNAGYTGKGVVVAVIDTGINYDHIDLKDHLWNGGPEYPYHGFDFVNDDNDPKDDHSHGTHCAGTVCGDGTSGTKTGMAPDATLMCIKVLNSKGSGNLSNLTSGVEFAVENGADILSLSLGWGFPNVTTSNSLRMIFNNVLEAGVIASVAAGNDGEYETYPRNIGSPGNCPPPWIHPDQQANSGGLSSVVCVGAVDYDDNVTYFSSQGPVTWQESDWKDYKYDIPSGIKNTDGWLHYDNGIYSTRIGRNSGGSVNWGIMFPAEAMQSYKQSSITKVAIYDGIEQTGNILIYKGGDNKPETLVHTQPYVCTGIEEYIEIDLTNDIPIDGNENIWITLRNDDGTYVASACNATHSKNGRWYSSNGTSWNDLIDLLFNPLPYTWMIRAYVSDSKSNNESIAGNNFGLIRPDISAPGYYIKSLSHDSNNGFTYMSGTSMATPCVAGVMALMLEKDPSLKPADICRILETSAYKLTDRKSNYTGSGRVDALAAIESIDTDEFVPTNLRLTKIDNNKIRLEWDAVAQKGTTYNVYRNNVKIQNVSTTYCEIEDISYNFEDAYTVTSVSNGVESTPSEPVVYKKDIKDSFIIDYENYSLQFTITSISPNEVSVKCHTFPTVKTTLYIPDVATTEDGEDFNVVIIENTAFYTNSEEHTNSKLNYFDGKLVIPNTVRTIQKSAFQYNGIQHVIMPNELDSIKDKVFYGCKIMHTIQFSNNLKYIGQSSFYDCDALSSIDLPSTLEMISFRAFSNCGGLKYVSLPSSFVGIGKGAFTNCSSLSKVRCKALTPPNFINASTYEDKYDYPFQGTSGNLRILVNAEVLEQYKEHEHPNNKIPTPVGWKYYMDKIFGLSIFVQDGDWSDESNWESLPTGGLNDVTDVTIDARAIIHKDEVINIETFDITDNGNLIIEEGGQMIHTYGEGNVTAEKYVEKYYDSNNDGYLEEGWHTISSPFTTLNVGQLQVHNGYELFRYDEPTYMWENVKNTSNDFSTLEKGRGYLYAHNTDATVSLTGRLNTGTVKQNLTASGEYLTGFNLIGNPYMHNIRKGEAIKSSSFTTGYYTLTDEGAWHAREDSEIITPLQGILVKTTSTLNLDIKQIAAESSSKRSSNSLIKVNVENSQYEDVAYVVFNGIGLDKIDHRNENIQKVYVPVDNINYAIAVQDRQTTEIPVNLEVKTMGEYTISISVQDFPCDNIVLHDNLNGNMVNILKEDYTFMATSNDRADRFTLKIDYKDNAIIYTDNTHIYIDNIFGDAIINIYDIKGNIVAQHSTNDSDYTISTESMSREIYLVNVIDNNGSYTQKIAIR